MSAASRQGQITHCDEDVSGSAQRAFTDAARVLAVRSKVDELALAVLSGPGLAAPAAGQLRELLESETYAAACRSWNRLEGSR